MSYVLRPESSRLASRVSRPLLALALALGLTPLFAGVPVSINFVGHLDAGAGRAVTEKNILMVFRLYSAPGTGRASEKATALWGRQASVALTDGDFDVDLSDSFGSLVTGTQESDLASAIARAVKDGSSNLWLGITPANDNNAEIYPRQKLTAVPKAVQALRVNALPTDFSVADGKTEVQGDVEVTGAATLEQGATYEKVAYGTDATLGFNGGVQVDGTLSADSVDATTVKAAKIETEAFSSGESGTLSVTGRLEAAGTVTWNGSLSASAATIAATKVSGKAEADTTDVRTLTASNLVNNSTTKLDTLGAAWHPIGDPVSVAAPGYKAETAAFYAWDTRLGTKERRTSISSGYWKAPCDCLAYFSTHLYNMSETHGTCIQFYIVVSEGQTSFESCNPVGITSFDPTGTFEGCVPIVLKKNQIVKWLAYNDNSAQTGVEELSHTYVSGITYVPFMW